jgi:DNA invertase Pin-like site-specific DNA recombinase
MKKAVAYIRISGQDQKDGISPETQLSQIKEQMKRDDDCELIDKYVDMAKSGYSDSEDIFTTPDFDEGFVIRINWNNRNQFIKLLRDAKQKKFDIVYFYMLSRLARNIMLQEGVFHYLNSLGIELRFIYGFKSTGDKLADMISRTINGVINQSSSLMTQIGTNSAFKRKFEQGLFPKPFFGYRGIKENGHIVRFEINQGEAKIIRTIFNDKINKISYQETCKKLGIDPKTYFRVLKRKEYAGYIIRSDEEKELPELAIIDLEIWKKAQN